MAIFLVSDNLAWHPRVAALDPKGRSSAMGLWVRALMVTARTNSEGFITFEQIAELDTANGEVEALIEAGLWIEVPGGYKAWNENNALYKIPNFAIRRVIKAGQKQRRRAKIRENGVEPVTTEFLVNLYASPCNVCGSTGQIEADHIIPIAKGGRHSSENLQPLCRKHNSKKGTQSWDEFLESIKNEGK